MPRYFFDLSGDETDPDPLGTELADDGAAAREASTLAGAWLSDRPARLDAGSLHVAVRDGAGRAIFSVHVEAGRQVAP